MTTRNRLDSELVRRGLARSREHAAEMISQGRVHVGGGPSIPKPASRVTTSAPITIEQRADGAADYVSRGGQKLAGALAVFEADPAPPRLAGCWPGGTPPAPALEIPDLALRDRLVVRGRLCLDAGASTGGFTDVLLRAGAAHVIAVDVGYGQLAWRLRTDPRVTVLDRVNVRQLQPAQLSYAPRLVTADLSFISLTVALPALIRCAEAAADFLLLVKPQFEAGKGKVGAGGVVRDPGTRAEAVMRVAHSGAAHGLGVMGLTASPLPGPSGNVEYFLWLRRGAPPLDTGAVARAIQDGPR